MLYSSFLVLVSLKNLQNFDLLKLQTRLDEFGRVIQDSKGNELNQSHCQLLLCSSFLPFCDWLLGWSAWVSSWVLAFTKRGVSAAKRHKSSSQQQVTRFSSVWFIKNLQNLIWFFFALTDLSAFCNVWQKHRLYAINISLSSPVMSTVSPHQWNFE